VHDEFCREWPRSVAGFLTHALSWRPLFNEDTHAHLARAACVLNATNEVAEVTVTLFFACREPVGPYRVSVPARRTLHLRFNDLTDPEPVPRDTDYATLIESTVPIVVPALSTGLAPSGNRPAFDNRIRLG
jgi:hypothetical protein